jgi:hypothetical protein
MTAVEQARDHRFTLLLPQAELDDAFGIRTVHANPVLQEPCTENLITGCWDTLKVPHRGGLQKAGEFDPACPHL